MCVALALSGVEVPADGVVARLEADSELAAPEVALSEDELDRVDDLVGRRRVFPATWVVGHDDHVRLPLSLV